MLMYDDLADCLVPMIYQEATNPKVDKLSREMAGNFPLRSFKIGLQLVDGHHGKGLNSKIALIVNDHIFQTPGWAMQGLHENNRAGNLRQKYYRNKYPLPKSYFKELRSIGLSSDVILGNNNPGRISGILPKNIRLFSEQALRNYFDQYRRIELRETDYFTEVPQKGSKSKLIFNEKSGGQPICLTENGDCGCSGELIEFFIRLSKDGFNKIIFFVPDECKLAVDAGIKAFLHLPGSIKGELKVVHVIHGLGGMGVDEHSNKPIELSLHRISLRVG